MKVYLKLIVVLFCISLLGCESVGDNTKKGAGLGALTGAAIGGIVGHQDGHGWEGALIGGAAGATAGGLIGNHKDKNDGNTQVAKQYIPVTEIVQKVQQGVPDDVIINDMKKSGSTYEMSSEIVTYLKNNGVSDRVINVMLSMK